MITLQSKKEKELEKVRFMENIKKSLEAGMLCTVDRETFPFIHEEHADWQFGCLCHITNDDTCLCDVTDINKWGQGS